MENKFIRSKFNGLTKEVYDWDFIFNFLHFLKKNLGLRQLKKKL